MTTGNRFASPAASRAADGPATLRATGVTKRYPGVVALEDVALEVAPGEVHALIGENGAGKSTMMKILFGVVQPDAGRIEIGGEPVAIHSPQAAQAHGVSMVHQELNLVPALDVARNVFLGREPARGPGLIDWPRLYREAADLKGTVAQFPAEEARIATSLAILASQGTPVEGFIPSPIEPIAADNVGTMMGGEAEVTPGA